MKAPTRAAPCAWRAGSVLRPGSLAHRMYGVERISERHRHRYEFNNRYRAPLEQLGMVMSGVSPDGNLVEIIELADHPWFLACQAHPEFTSTPRDGHPLFIGFIRAARGSAAGRWRLPGRRRPHHTAGLAAAGAAGSQAASAGTAPQGAADVGEATA